MLRAPADVGFSSRQGKRFFSPWLRGVAVLGSARVGRELPDVLEQARELVGLGEGLTPSGDDLLGGYLFTLRLLDQASEHLLGIDWARIEEWLCCATPLTSKISFAILADHARGAAGYPLWALLYDAIGGFTEQHLAQRALRVSQIGHSSGWDMLAGVFCGASVVLRFAENIRERMAPASDEANWPAMAGLGESRKGVLRVC
jgi:hypothetical protein